jgi:hypothetical protein
LTFTNNILPNNQHGIVISNGHNDASAIRSLFTNLTITGNVWAGAPEAGQFAGNYYPNSLADIGLVNYVSGNLADVQLTAQSPFDGLATDGGNPGVNIGTLGQKTASAISGVPVLTNPVPSGQ